MNLTNSRRLTGPSLFLDGPGAAIDISGDDDVALAAEAWTQAVRKLLDQLGWTESVTVVVPYDGGATLVFSAPEDALYTACEVNEAAWEAATGDGTVEPTTIEALRQAIEEERDPRRVALADAAAQHGVRFLADDEQLSLGSGRGCQVWPVSDLPGVDAVDWSSISDIPVALITGTNGKTTTARMLSAIASAAGLTAGNTSTDGVQIAGEMILEGDYTGGEGARAVLQNQRVEIAFLENARGGMLRRGLPIERAEAALVTNVGTDHLGEYGIDTLEDLARVKLLVAKAVRETGTLVVNADDPQLASASANCKVAFSLQDDAPPPAFVRRRGRLGKLTEDGFVPWLEVADIPATLGGAALHNAANALGAMAVADAVGISRQAIVEGLSSFGADAASNPGRANLFDLSGMRAFVDFAHNPEGLTAVLDMAARMGAERTLMLTGQAGDRDDASIRKLAAVAAQHNPDRIIVKDMAAYLRGRREGEVVELIVDALKTAGYDGDRIGTATDEMTAVRQALEWGRPGDVLLLLVLSERASVLKLLQLMDQAGWRPGDPLPD